VEADAARLARVVMQRCDELATFSEQPGELTRRFATPAARRASDAVRRWMLDAELSVREDAAGNLVGRAPASARGRRTLLLGSHLDSVRNAGRYDGPLGVLAAIGALELLKARGERLPFAVDVYAFSDEEGTRFGTAYLGSAAVAGGFAPGWLERRDEDGVSMAEALRSYGGDPAALASARRDPDDLIGWVELHIEQGPLLEERGHPVGVVEAIAGQTRWEVELTGAAGHAGTVPMEGRRDALCAAAEVVLAVEDCARECAGLVATVGELTAAPGAANVIPGGARLSVDVRHADNAVRRAALQKLEGGLRRIASARGVELSLGVRFEHDAVPCSPQLVEALERAVAAAGVEPLRLVSGAGHDAVQLARVTPVGMLFVRCEGGVSHDPAEAVAEADVAVALEALGRFLCELSIETSEVTL
jgi:allantoate deiminase